MPNRPFYALPILLGIIGTCLGGCVSGSVSTVFYKDPPHPRMFYVISPDSRDPTNRNLSNLIEAKMSERGYTKALSFEAANIGVLFQYSVDPTASVVSDGSTFTTVYPRRFQILVIDLEQSKLPEKVEPIWQGEIYSAGTSQNISRLAPIFVEQVFLNYGQTVTNERFSH